MRDAAERAKAALDDTRCTDTMMDFFQVGLVRELVAEVERLRAQETLIRELCAETEDEKWRRKIARAFDGSTFPHMVRADDVLAALDTEGER
ncbi:hypothetical protein SEA_FRANKIE_90 [Mycobacterium phage Frankie]|nr:hypothetical protein SEA_FRANKIE_90 [Mycobacterium phage Frankie]